MKKIITACLMACATCNLNAQNYLIEGNAKGADGEKVYLGEVITRKEVKYIDSTTVVNGTFRMSNPLQEVKKMNVFIGKTSQSILLDDNPINVNYSIETKEVNGKQITMPKMVVSGDDDQKLLKLMDETMTQEMIGMLLISVMGKDKDVNAPENKALADSISTIYTTMKTNTKQVFDSIVTNCKDSYISAMIINDFYCKERSASEVQDLYNQLSARVRNSNVGQNLRQTLDNMLAIGIGQIAPDFTLKTPEGKEISLSSLRGKCVLIDFWASWCGPCIKEAPNVKRVYDLYHEKGFEVISVSLDDDKDKWTAAIAKHNLTWLHVSSLKGWKCPVAKQYQVSGIPAMFLIDKDGRITSNKARGEALEIEVAKICK